VARSPDAGEQEVQGFRNWSDGILQQFGSYSIRTRCAAVSELGDGFSDF